MTRLPRLRVFIPLWIALFVVAAFHTSSHAQGKGRRPLLRSAATADAHRDRPAHGPKPRRSRAAALQLEALATPDGSNAEPIVELNLFDDLVLQARVQRFESKGPGSFTWHGRLEGVPTGHATFVSTAGVVAGTVFADGAAYEVKYAGDGAYEVSELDPAAFPTDDPPSASDLAPVVPADAPAAVASDSASQIDVMVVWTPAAETAAGGLNAMRSLVDLSVANTNTAYANSGISTRVRLVYKGAVSYTESSISTDLARLSSPSDGYMDAVHSLRDQYGADIVSLLGTTYVGSGACGIGYLMGYVSTGFASSAFNVVDQACAAGNLSYAHEVGHNEGMHHDPANASGAGAYSYSYGYIDPGCAFRTVMAYGGCTRVTQFSSPTVTYGGKVTGTSTQNNARTLNNTASTVANFRQAVSGTCTYMLSASSYAAPAGGGASSVGLTASASSCSWTAVSSAPSWLTITAGAGGTASGTVSFSVAANTGAARSATLTIGGQTFTVAQAAAQCTYALGASSWSPSAAGGSSSVAVVVTGGSCAWTAVSNAPSWLAVTSGATGTASGTVTFSASANTVASPRMGTITIAGQTFTVTEAAAPCSYAVTPLSMTPAATGATSTVTVAATGGCGWTATPSASWIAVTNGAGTGSGSVIFTIAANTTGSSRSATVAVADRTITVTQASPWPPPAVLSLTASPALPVATGTQVTWTARTAGGRQPTQYRFWLFEQATGQWTVGREWGAQSTWTWRPARAGTYQVQVWVRSAGCLADYEAWRSSGTVTVLPSAVKAYGIESDRPRPFAPGTAVKWTVAARGGAAPLEYQFWGYDGSSWSLIRDYAADPSVTWTVGAGTRVLQGWVRTVGSSAAYEAWVGTGTFQVAPSTVKVTLQSNQSFPLPVNTPITWTATGTGGSASLEYQFWRYNGSAWTVVQDWSPTSRWSWTPGATDAGTYSLQVWARSAGQPTYEAWTSSGTFTLSQ